MFAFHSHQSVILVLSVQVCAVVISAAIAATVPSTSESISISVEDSLKGDKTFIVYGKSEESVPVDLVCECVPYYLCNPEDAILFPTGHHDHGPNQCQGEIQVCCAIRNQTSSSTQSSLPVEESSLATETEKVDFNGTTEATTGANDSHCECMMFFLCSSEQSITSDQCGDPNQVCCKTTTTTTTEPKVITYYDDWWLDDPSDKPVKVEFKCECTLFYECHPEDVIESSKLASNEGQCPDSYVCCKNHSITSLDV